MNRFPRTKNLNIEKYLFNVIYLKSQPAEIKVMARTRKEALEQVAGMADAHKVLKAKKVHR